MKSGILVSLALVLGLTTAAARAATPDDEELRTHLDALARRVEDLSIELGLRERLAMEMAATLDRAATSAARDDARRALWSEAAGVLDRFSARNGDHVQRRAFEVQASVYLWARARTWLRAYRINPADATARTNAVAELEACVNRLKPVVESLGGATDLLAQNARFRLAQALADVAEVGPDDPSTRRLRNTEALDVLSRPAIAEPTLLGFSRLLRATVLARLGRFDEALTETAAAAKSQPPPPESEAIEPLLAVLLGKKEFAAALKAIDGTRLEPGAKAALRCRARLDERAAHPDGAEREAAETALFGELKALRASSRPEFRGALISAARAIDEPGPDQKADAWDLLAEGALALGDPARAGALERRAAERAEALGHAADAASYRLRAGAYLFQAGKYAEADPLLGRVAHDPKAGANRPRAGLLLALARGRALALGRPEVSRGDYAAALRDQIKNFPDDPSASEARWLLGKLRLAESDRDGALALWEAIPHGAPRWPESRSEIAAVQRHDLEFQQLNNDRSAIARRLADARAFLAKSLEQAVGDAETNEILLASARLELTPGVGSPDRAQKVWERLQRSAARPDQRDAARGLHVAALAEQNRWVEAEQAARAEVRLSRAVDLLALARLLDRAAADSESDLRTRRIGYILRILMSRVLEDPEALPADLRAEARLRSVRALLFSGDGDAARRAVAAWSASPAINDPALLRDLAETYARLDAHELAIDVQRLRARRAATGSLPWFDARYGLALAYYRAGKAKDALHLIDATSILHPDLGGGELRDKFIRLRQRIDPIE